MTPRIHSPINLALEAAALQALRGDFHTWGDDAPVTAYWARLAYGLAAAGALGAVARGERRSNWLVLWELTPDDPLYYGLCGDGQGDLFAVSRESVTQCITFPPLPDLT